MTFSRRLWIVGLAAMVAFAAASASAQELIYTSNFNDSFVSGVSLNLRSGALTLTPGSPYAASLGPEQMAASADDSFVYVAAATWYPGGSLAAPTTRC